VTTSTNGEDGLAQLVDEPDLVVTDIQMPGIDGMEVLRRIRETDDGAGGPPVVMLTAHGSVKQAVEAMRSGAFTYLLKPFAREELTLTVAQALRTRDLEHDNLRLRGLLRRRQIDSGLVYRSACMKRFMADLRKTAPNDATVLIVGESGTGKELAARACHDLSSRWDKPFVAVN